METRNLEGGQKVNPNALRLNGNQHEVCKYCGRKAYWYLKFKTTSAYCCESYHGECPSIREKALAAERKYGPDYKKYQEAKREAWKRRQTDSMVSDDLLKC